MKVRPALLGLCLFLGLACLAWLAGCAGPPSLRDFPERTATPAGAVPLSADWQGETPRRILHFAVGDGGALYLATLSTADEDGAANAEPAELVKVSPAGEVLWRRPFSESGGGAARLVATGSGVLSIDPASGAVAELDADGRVLRQTTLTAAYDAVVSPGGWTYVFPNASGFLLDVFDDSFRYLASLLPLPDPDAALSPAAAHLLPDGGDGVIVLWNPGRTVYRLGPGGERRGEFTLDPPDVVANVETRLRGVRERGGQRGLQATIHPFLDLIEDPDGHLGALYLFQDGNRFEAALYRFTREGEAVDVIRGLGAAGQVAFDAEGDLLVLPLDGSAIRRFDIP